ncbi:MAG: cadmium-translocating P-type ATPase [Gammaproteobacteria bacterium]|nr:cadmium-translocating P-type ATPase [Gammaproteobacteria bacterium]
MSQATSCYHCGEQILTSAPVYKVAVNDQEHDTCCLGCKAITEHIYNSGLQSYYELRSDLATKPDDNIDSKQFDIYQDQDFLDLVSEKLENNTRKILLSVDNIHCAACAWLIEQTFNSVQGITKVSVNTVNQRAEFIWQDDEITLSDILAKLASIGYPSSPFKVTNTEQKLRQQNKQYIKRLGVAGLFTMQVMMIAFAMYFGAFTSMESHQTGYFKWLSMLLTLPVVFYSALPFLFGSISSLKAKKLNMDVPVAIAIYGAFLASFYQLIIHGLDGAQGEVFFESIAMFTFLLLIGKYLEFRAKSKAILSNANLHKNIPTTACKLVNNEQQTVLVKNLVLNDIILIKPGEHIAVDGEIIKGESSINESVLNGEFEPVNKQVGDKVFAGSVNNDGVITIKVTALGDNTTLSKISNLQAEFSNYKPEFTQFADKIAHQFVFSQLVLAVITYVVWYFYQPVDAFWVSLSVLVATCPCALSLATPTAYTCILSTLNRQGILIKNPEAFDKLTKVTHVAFDKTGTLTQGQFSISASRYIETNLISKLELNCLIVHLQLQSEHPIAKAFTKSTLQVDANRNLPSMEQVKVHVGKGVSAIYKDLQIKIGSASFCLNDAEQSTSMLKEANVFVTVNNQLCAEFEVADKIKPEAQTLLSKLSEMDLSNVMLTGDSSINVERIAKTLNLKSYKKACSPSDKARWVAETQNESNNRVLMVGDGINDAPVFSTADVSIAMGSGADITKFSADIIILKDNLNAIETLFNAAKRTQKIIKQNLNWSLVYNLIILPVAMAGYVAPYVAVIGMSASSILVVSNSLRLLNKR